MVSVGPSLDSFGFPSFNVLSSYCCFTLQKDEKMISVDQIVKLGFKNVDRPGYFILNGNGYSLVLNKTDGDKYICWIDDSMGGSISVDVISFAHLLVIVNKVKLIFVK